MHKVEAGGRASEPHCQVRINSTSRYSSVTGFISDAQGRTLPESMQTFYCFFVWNMRTTQGKLMLNTHVQEQL